MGRSIMEICLTDTISIRDALSNYNPHDTDLKGSILDMICRDDEIRKETFIKINFYPKK